MTKNLFKLSCELRQIDQANHMMYKTGVPHVARVLAEHDFIYMVDGEWEIIQNDKTYKMQSNDVLILHAHESHSGIVPCRPDTHTIFFHVNHSKNDRFLRGHNKEHVLEPQWDFIILPTLISCGYFLSIKQRFEDIVAVWYSKTNQSSKAYRMSYLFGLLLLDLAECVEKTRIVGGTAEEAAKLIRSNPHVFLKERELSEKLHISEKGLRQAFRRVYGLTPYKYQLRLKLEMACYYLQNHYQMKLSEIASNLGFYDEFHFSRHFKAVYGIPPGKWRKNRGKDFKKK